MTMKFTMLKGFFEKYGFAYKMIIAIFVVTFCMSVTTIISKVFFIDNPTYAPDMQMRLTQMVGALGLFIFPPLIIAYLFSKNSKDYLSLKRSPLFYLLTGLCCSLLAAPFVNLLVELNEMIPLPSFLDDAQSDREELTELLLGTDSYGVLLLNLLVLAFIPAFGEELTFHSIFQKSLQRRGVNIHLCIWITAALFSAIHFEFGGFFARMTMGALFGYFLVISGSIWVPIVCHFINNALIIIIIFFSPDYAEDYNQIGTSVNIFSLAIGIASAISIGVILYYLWHYKAVDEKSREDSPIV